MRELFYTLALLFAASTLFISCRSNDTIPVESVTIIPSELSIEMGTPATTLTPIIHPSNATNHAVTWTSDNSNIASVNAQTGAVTAVSIGQTYIRVTTADGARTNRATVTVTPAPIPVTSVSIAGCTATPLAIGATHQLTATVLPANATNRIVTWTSSNNNIATVNNYGLVTALTAGTATITATTADGGKTATCMVTIPAPIAVTGVTLAGCHPDVPFAINDTRQFVATITPNNAANQNVTWTSSNNSVATVNNYGLVTARAAGTATITVTTADGGRTATCVVTVMVCQIDNPAGVVLNGIRWATRNVDMPGTFAQHPESAGRFFQWGTLNGVVHHWPATGAVTGWNNSCWQRDAWTAANDPCPQGWRVPTQQQLQSLANEWSFWTQRNGVSGRLFGHAPNQIFLPAAGTRDTNGTFHSVAIGDLGAIGSYWSSSPTFGWSSNAGVLQFVQAWGGVWVPSTNRAQGFSVRCVAE